MGAGFIGSHLVDRLLADGCRVRVLDDFSSGRRENLAAAGDIQVMAGLCGAEFRPVYGEARPGDIRHSLADIHKAVEVLKLEPGIVLEQGLASLLEGL